MWNAPVRITNYNSRPRRRLGCVGACAQAGVECGARGGLVGATHRRPALPRILPGRSVHSSSIRLLFLLWSQC